MRTFESKIYLAGLCIVVVTLILIGCSGSTGSKPPPESPEGNPPDSVGEMPDVVEPDITVAMHGTKISQLVGDYDREEGHKTINKTLSRYQLKEADLGVPFRYNNRTYVLFGDTHGAIPGNRDAIAYTTDTNPDNGISLTFLHSPSGVWKPVTIPGIGQGAFDVPMEGVEVNDKMYIYATTDHTAQKTMGRSVVAISKTGGADFRRIYELSSRHYINVSVVKTTSTNINPSSPEWNLLPENKGEGEGVVIFGSGSYRKSNVYLAYQPASKIDTPNSVRYFTGIDKKGKPLWGSHEVNAVALFSQPCVGELSVTYNSFIDRWIMLYNCGDPRGINMRTAKDPWGPWTKPQVIFDPWEGGGYCHFMHTSWENQRCDRVMDLGRENVWGGEYGPYQYAHFAKGDGNSTTIYFNMSTWNPYTVVLMKAKLAKLSQGMK